LKTFVDFQFDEAIGDLEAKANHLRAFQVLNRLSREDNLLDMIIVKVTELTVRAPSIRQLSSDDDKDVMLPPLKLMRARRLAVKVGSIDEDNSIISRRLAVKVGSIDEDNSIEESTKSGAHSGTCSSLSVNADPTQLSVDAPTTVVTASTTGVSLLGFLGL